MQENAGSTKRGTGFSIEGVASAGGKVGGKISRRPRTIRVGQPLTSQEMLFMADGISSIVSALAPASQTEIDEVEELLKKTTNLLMSGKWNLVFSQTCPSPIQSLSKWKEYLLRQWKVAHDKISAGDLTEDDNEWLRSLRNVSEAYDVTNNTKTKWTQEAKKLA